MKAKSKRPRLPTEAQSRTLRRIAQNGGFMMLTREFGNGDRYSDGAGVVIDGRMAKRFIANGWVIGQRDSMFDLTPQTWRVKEFCYNDGKVL